MAEITVRKLQLSFNAPDSIHLDVADKDFTLTLSALAVSLTMPYLEPYLIRTMKVALGEIRDEQLAEDVRRFSQQEGHHFRNHMKFNENIRAQFSRSASDELISIEQALERDYQQFTREEPLRFNVAYAEGFEAFTCSAALATVEFQPFQNTPWGDLFAWHLAEEIEHRTVAFDVFEHLVGSYAYRIRAGCWSQWHYLRVVDRLMRAMARSVDRKIVPNLGPLERTTIRNYLRTLSPRYNPASIPMPAGVDETLAAYSVRAANQ